MYDHPPADDPRWPDDTHALMFAAVGQRRYPVTVPVLADDVEIYCTACRHWSSVDEWELNGDDFLCPRCFAEAPDDEHGEFERRAVGLFTCILPVPPRHEKVAFADDARRQAVNAIAAARAARAQARKHGLELA